MAAPADLTYKSVDYKLHLNDSISGTNGLCLSRNLKKTSLSFLTFQVLFINSWGKCFAPGFRTPFGVNMMGNPISFYSPENVVFYKYYLRNALMGRSILG